MTWADFKTAVLEELGVDGTRRGIEALRSRATRDAVVDLQRYIRAFRDGHTTTYNAVDLEAIDFAHLGTLPAQAKPKALYIVSQVPNADATLPNPNCARNRLDFVAWQDRQCMICDQRGVRRYQYSISPFSRQFMVHPLINDETYLLIVWDGLKMTFADGDVVPWPEQAAEAVGAYVKWKILLEVDKRADIAREWFDKGKNTGIYPNLRLALFREQNEAQSADGKDEEYVDNASVQPPLPTILANYGAQTIPFLSVITVLSGGSNNALASIPTATLTVPFTVEISIGGNIQTWQLQSGTAATGPGIQRPDDYNGATNAKIWVQVA